MQFSIGARDFVIRNLEYRDAAHYLHFFNALDAPSIRCRYGYMVASLSLERAQEIVSLDPVWHPALAVFTADESEILAVGRFHSDTLKQTAEIAVVVATAMRGLGIGRIILDSLIKIAASRSLEKLHAYVVTPNAPVIDLLRSFGFSIDPQDHDSDLDDGETKLTLSLDSPLPLARH